jgi:hypothetical protein
MINAFATKPSLRSASRLPSLAGESTVSMMEIACLLACGVLASIAVGFGPRLVQGAPGHAILRGVLPIALGLAIVPRRSAGITMSVGAGLTAALMSWQGVGRFQPAAVLSILALGPVLDVALAGRPQGWRLYVRFTLAGVMANLLAFAVRFGTAHFGWDLRGSHHFMSFASTAFLTFILFGAVAGLVSAALWFRLRVGDDLRRS